MRGYGEAFERPVGNTTLTLQRLLKLLQSESQKVTEVCLVMRNLPTEASEVIHSPCAYLRHTTTRSEK
jgi:hypothetical protein